MVIEVYVTFCLSGAKTGEGLSSSKLVSKLFLLPHLILMAVSLAHLQFDCNIILSSTVWDEAKMHSQCKSCQTNCNKTSAYVKLIALSFPLLRIPRRSKAKSTTEIFPPAWRFCPRQSAIMETIVFALCTLKKM